MRDLILAALLVSVVCKAAATVNPKSRLLLDFTFHVNTHINTTNLFGSTNYKHYTTLPALPDGIGIVNGSIEGSSESVLFKTEYQVDAYAPSSHSCINIYVTIIETPAYCTFGFVTLYSNPGSYLDVTPQCNTPIYSFTTQNSSPNGLWFNRESGRLFGIISDPSALPVYIVFVATNQLGSTEFHLTIEPSSDHQDFGVSFCFANSKGCHAFWSFSSLLFTTCDFDYAINFERGGPFTSSTMLVNSYLSVPDAGTYSFMLECIGACVMFLGDMSDPLIDKSDCDDSISSSASVVLNSQEYPILLYCSSNDGFHVLKLFWLINGAWEIVGSNYFHSYRVPPTFFVYSGSFLQLDPSEAFSLNPLMLGYANTFRLLTYHPYISLSEETGVLSGQLYFNESVLMSIIVYNWDGYDYTTVQLDPAVGRRFLQGTSLKLYLAQSTQCNGEIFEAGKIGVDNLGGQFQVRGVAMGAFTEEELDFQDYAPLNLDPAAAPDLPPTPLSSTLFQGQMLTFLFEGSLALPVSGLYGFRLEFHGPGTFTFLSSTTHRSGCSRNHSIERSIELDSGIYPFKIQYGSYSNDTYLHFSWNHENLTSGFEPIPSSAFVTPNPVYFTYQTSFTLYVFNATIPVNIPLRSFPPKTHFSIYPRLPEGLHMSSVNGRISGLPDVAYFPQTPFTVRARINDSFTVRSTISIGVVPYNPPRQIEAICDGLSTRVLFGVVGEPIHPVEFSFSGKTSLVRFDPKLPKGLQYDSLTRVIYGLPIVSAFCNTTVYFRSPFGVSIFQMIVKITPNASLEIFYVEINNPHLTEVSLVVWDGSTPVLEDRSSKEFIVLERIYTQKMLKLVVTPDSNKMIFYKLFIGVDSLLAYGYIDFSFNIEFNNTLSQPISFSFGWNNSFIFYWSMYNQQIALWEGPISSFELVGCPDSLHIHSEYGIITGDISGRVGCIVRASNPLSSKDVTIFIGAASCNDMKNQLQLELQTKLHSRFTTIIMFSEQNNDILYLLNDLSPMDKRTYNLCPPSDYHLFMLETVNGAWRGSGFTLKYSGVPAATYFGTHLLMDSVDVMSVDLNPFFSSSSLFFCYYYDESTLDPDWLLPGFDSSSWNCMQGSLPMVSSNSLFVLVHLSMSPSFLSKKYFTLFLHLINDTVTDLYLSGRPLSKGINASLIHSLDQEYMSLNGLISDYFSSKDAILGMQFLSLEKRNWYGNLDLGIRTSSSFLVLTKPGTVTLNSEQSFGQLKSFASSLVDFDETTISYFYYRTQPPKILFNITSTGITSATATMYSITNGISGRMADPASWVVYSLQLNGNRQLIDFRENEIFFGQQTRFFPLTGVLQLFSCLEFEFLDFGDVSRNTHSDRIEMAELHIYLKETAYCEAVGIYSATLAGTSWTHNCGIGFDGVLTRECFVNRTWGPTPSFWTHCRLIAPENLEYRMKFTDLVFNLPLENIRSFIPRIGGANLFFESTPPLPAGLLLNQSTGEISGVPKMEITSGSFVIAASNMLGSTNTTISISIRKEFCPPTGLYPLTELFETAVIHCTGKTGTMKCTCLYVNQKVAWGPEIDNCGESPSTPLIPILIVSLTVVSVILVPLLIFVFKRLTRDKGKVEGNHDLDNDLFYSKLIDFEGQRDSDRLGVRL